MEQPISGHVVRLLPAHSSAILRLENGQEIAVRPDCMQVGTLARLHIGDRVWYFGELGEGMHI